MKHDLIINKEGKVGKRPPLTGVAALGAAMAAQLHRRLDYHGLARKLLGVEQLPPGALPIYEKYVEAVADSDISTREKFEHRAFRIDNNGKASRSPAGARVRMPTFEVYDNPTIKIADIRQRRFPLIDRSLPKKVP